jgi:hypothetical protein
MELTEIIIATLIAVIVISTQCFARFLKILQELGQHISHEAISGLPAFTIEERLANISQYCSI